MEIEGQLIALPFPSENQQLQKGFPLNDWIMKAGEKLQKEKLK
jgi:hypothetical protein